MKRRKFDGQFKDSCPHCDRPFKTVAGLKAHIFKYHRVRVILLINVYSVWFILTNELSVR